MLPAPRATAILACAMLCVGSAHGLPVRIATREAPAKLRATAASRQQVALAWDSDASSPSGGRIAVERKLLGTPWPTTAQPATAAKPSPSTIAVVTAATATDAAIDAYATYVYRVRTVAANNTLGAPSNEITVGPPPVGIHSVLGSASAAHQHDADQFVGQIRLALDANDDPVVAYVTFDADGNGENDDSELSTISWNRAAYRWNAPVRIDVVGDVGKSGSRIPVALARDASTGTLGVVYVVGDHEVRYAVSSDGGATWAHATVQQNGRDDPSFSTPALALAGGRAFAAYAVGVTAVRFRTGAGDRAAAASGWTASDAPKLPNTESFRTECVQVVVDDAGVPGVSYCLNPSDGYNTSVAFWKPGAPNAVKLADTNGRQSDDVALELTRRGSQLAAAFYAARDDQFFANHHVWFVRSGDGGATWSAPLVVADDGGDAMGAPVSVTLDRAGRPAMTATVTGGTEGTAKCGWPKVMRPASGGAWVTCAPETKGAPALSHAIWPVGRYAGNDKLYVAFRTVQSASGLAPGLVLWREP